jgi:hypothetical protein
MGLNGLLVRLAGDFFFLPSLNSFLPSFLPSFLSYTHCSPLILSDTLIHRMIFLLLLPTSNNELLAASVEAPS